MVTELGYLCFVHAQRLFNVHKKMAASPPRPRFDMNMFAFIMPSTAMISLFSALYSTDIVYVEWWQDFEKSPFHYNKWIVER